MIPSSRSLLSRDKRLPLDTRNTSVLQENVFGNQFSTFDSPRDYPQKNSVWRRAKKPWSSAWSRKDEELFTQVKTDRIKAQFQCRQLQQSRRRWVLQCRWITAEQHCRTAKTASIGTAIRQIPRSTIILGVENTIQKSSDYVFRFSIGSNVMDQRSGDGWFIGRLKILAICFRK